MGYYGGIDNSYHRDSVAVLDKVDEHLEETRRLAERLLYESDPYVAELAARMLDLDDHLRTGGTMPARWQKAVAALAEALHAVKRMTGCSCAQIAKRALGEK